MTVMSLIVMTVMSSCMDWRSPSQKKTETEKVMVLRDANIYQCIIEKQDSLNTEYYVFVYAKDKYDAERIADMDYASKEKVRCIIRIIKLEPINTPFKYEIEASKDSLSDISRCKVGKGKKHIDDLAKSGRPKGKKGKPKTPCVIERYLV